MEAAEILKILLRDEVLAPEVDVKALAKRTEGFSGSDLKRKSRPARLVTQRLTLDIDVCVAAALDAVKEGVTLPWAHVSTAPVVDTPATTTPPTAPSPEAVVFEEPAPAPSIPDESPSTDPPEATLSDSPDFSDPASPSPPSTPSAPTPTTSPRILRPHHFTKALHEITASTSESLGTLSDLRKWNEEFGEGGSKRGNKRRWGDKFGFTIGEGGVQGPPPEAGAQGP